MKWFLQRRSSLSIVEFLLICAGAFLVVYRASGRSPIVLYDTSAEESFVQWCLQKHLCPLYGGPTNLAGFWQGGAWIYLRTFFSWLGLAPGAVHLLVQVLDALAVGLIAVCGTMLHSRLAGIIAAAIAVWLLPQSEIIIGLHNSRFMFFPAGLCTLLCLASLRTRKPLPLYLAAVTAAVVANVHAACLPLIISVALVGALRSGKRVAAFLYWGGVAAVLTVLLSPGVWSYHLVSLFRPGASIVQPSASFDLSLSTAEIIGILAILALTARCVLQPLPSSEILSSRALLAVLVPGLLLLLLSGAFVGVERTSTYAIFLIPAFSLATASAGLWLLEYLKPLAGKLRRLDRPIGVASAAIQTIAPCALGGALIWTAVWGDFPQEPKLLFEDLGELKEQLHSAGWGPDNQYRHVKNPLDQELLSALLVYLPMQSSPVSEEDAGQNLYVFKASRARLPAALPGNWSVSARDDGSALVVVRSPTWLDWKNFSACTGKGGSAEMECVDSGLRYAPTDYLQIMPPVPGLAHPSQVLRRRVQIRFPVRIPPVSGYHAIIMPALEFRCRGRIVSVPEGNSKVLPGGREALLASSEEPVAGTLVIEWIPGGQDCPEIGYGAFPPFFIEAEPRTADQIDRLLTGGG
jgi:hypothetical protein